MKYDVRCSDYTSLSAICVVSLNTLFGFELNILLGAICIQGTT